jgi:predicted ATPase/class 3 adenylate cyclase
LPTGVVTFLFSDLESSTSLARELGERWPEVLTAHHETVRGAVEEHDGVVVRTMGDGFFVAFSSPDAATAAACDIQRRVAQHESAGRGLACRIGLHTGSVAVVDGDYIGLSVHEAARIADVASGGQVLATESVRHLAGGTRFRPLGAYAIRDFGDVNLFEVVWDPRRGPGLPRATPSNRMRLPSTTTRFIGRTAQVDAVVRLVEEHRLVTITGPGGVGKTRLAIEAARRVQTADGTWFVDLTAAADDDRVASTVATTMELRSEGKPAEEVLSALADRDVLIVLDNCEHVIEGAAALARSIVAQTGASVIATSREALAVGGEALFDVPALDPQTDAVELFVERASQAGRTVGQTPDDRVAIAALCERLDGLPLAIELAASLVRTLSIDQLTERLDDRFGLLQSRDRDRRPRQRTLWAAVDWSHQLLEEAERAVLRRLSVFAAGFTIDAAEHVVVDADVAKADVFRLVDALVSKSLVAVVGAVDVGRGVPGFRLLESIREYSLERLAEASEERSTRLRHLQWATELAHVAQVDILGPNELRGFEVLDLAAPDLRSAIEWGIEEAPELALQCIGNLYGYLGSRLDHPALLPVVERALAVDAGSPSVRARAHAVASFLGGADGDYDAMDAHSSAALTLLDGRASTPYDAWTKSWSLTDRGFVAHHRGDFDAAMSAVDQALEVASGSGVDVVRARPLQGRGEVLASVGRVADGVAVLDEAVAVLRQQGMCNGRCYLLTTAATLQLRLGRVRAAAVALEEALVAAEQLKERSVIVTAAVGLAALLASVGADPDRVRAIGDRAADVALSDGLQDLLGRRLRTNTAIAVAMATTGPTAQASLAALAALQRVADAMRDPDLAADIAGSEREVAALGES